MRGAIMQPTYLPWLGYFDLIRNVDLFIIYDHVQFEKQSWQVRNRIRNRAGELMLTVPVIHDKGLIRSINEVKIDYSRNVLSKHLTSIKFSYSRSERFQDLKTELEEIYNSSYELLIDLNVKFIRFGMKLLNIDTEIRFSSSMNVQGNKVEALIDVCKKNSIDHYLSPVGSKTYIDENNIFNECDIELAYQDFSHPVYQQFQYPDFISHLSFIDFLLNVSKYEAESFGSIIQKNN